ncbi:MAG: hypothetical protein ABFC96_10565 [Thermoguttaceae bacterium]
MSNYIPHYTKRLTIFRKKRDHLHRLISRGGEKAKLLRAADEVRLAKIRAVGAQRPPNFGPDDWDEASKWAKGIRDRISALEKMTPEAALVEFGQ